MDSLRIQKDFVMKKLLILLILWTSVQAGTVYDLTDQLSPAGTPGLARQGHKVTMTPLHRFTILADNRTTTSSMMMYSKVTWSAAFDSLLDIDGAAGAGSIDATFPSMIHSLGETLFVDITDDGGPQTHTRYTDFTFVARDTVTTLIPTTARIVGSWYLAGDSMIVVTDEDLATDSTTLQLSNGQIAAGTVWTEITNDARVANAGVFIPVYDGVGQSRYGVKFNMNTDDVIVYDRLNGETVVSTAITGVALTALGYAAADMIHLAGDTFLVAYQKGLTSTKGLYVRPFYITWTGTTPTGVGFNDTEAEIIADAAVADSFRVCPALSGIHGRADSAYIWFRHGTTRDPEGVYRAFTADGGRNWGAAVKEIDTSEVYDDFKFWMLQAPPDLASSAGVQYLGLAFSDSVTTSGSAHLYAWTDTLYNVAAPAPTGTRYINSAITTQYLNNKTGPPYVNKK